MSIDSAKEAKEILNGKGLTSCDEKLGSEARGGLHAIKTWPEVTALVGFVEARHRWEKFGIAASKNGHSSDCAACKVLAAYKAAIGEP